MTIAELKESIEKMRIKEPDELGKAYNNALDFCLEMIDVYDKFREDEQALSQEPCDDAISREDAYKIVMMPDTPYGKHKGTLIRELPPVTPSNERVAFLEHELKVNVKKWKDAYEEGKKDGRPKGCWVGIDEKPHEDYECNRCGYVCSTFTANIKPSNEYKFCPNCGAKMESEDEE